MLENDDFNTQIIKFHKEQLNLDSWSKRIQYDMIKSVLGAGINLHLKENEYIRYLFDLGVPIKPIETQKTFESPRVNKLEKLLVNKEQFREQTKRLSKKRDGKSSKINDIDDYLD
jgi:hypothetical protein